MIVSSSLSRVSRRLGRLSLWLCLAFFAASCAPSAQQTLRPTPPPLAPAAESPEAIARELSLSTQQLKSWNELAPGLRRSLQYLDSKPAEQLACDSAALRVTWGKLRLTAQKLLELLPQLDAHPELLAEKFTWKKVEPSVLFSGYYEPYIEASLTPQPGYRYPLYNPPHDLARRKPHFDRAAIDYRGALKGKGLEIAWAKDPIDLFFLHIQGSGKLVLPDGSVRHVRYAGTNGAPYVALGRKLIEMGYMTREEMSMQKTRELLLKHPDKMQEWFSLNPKYVFFKMAEDGPYGAMGALLTPMASVAVDRSYIPLGSIMAVRADLPGFGGQATERFAGLVLAQDTGTMKQNHLDLFCGSNEKAIHQAGHMKGQAYAHVLVYKGE